MLAVNSDLRHEYILNTMKRFILFFGLTVFLILGIFLAIAASLPKHYRVERSIVINADAETVHAYLGDLEQWDAWTPWKEMDPDLVVTLGEKTVGVGATQEWDDVAGGGRLEFTRSSPETGIAYDLYFADFPKVDASMNYSFPGEDVTAVNWIMEGEVTIPVFGGIFAMTMDTQVGPMFELGLEKLKAVVED